MHFFYLDESGDTGLNLHDADQPIMVLGGISLRDEGWNATHSAMLKILQSYFWGALPPQFELHAKQLLAPHGEGPFAGHPMQQRSDLARALLQLLQERKHGDSLKNPMIQLSDLVSLCVRRFLEIDGGYHPQWTPPAIQFYAQAYALITDRVDKVRIEPRSGRESEHLNAYLEQIAARPRSRWRNHYGL